MMNRADTPRTVARTREALKRKCLTSQVSVSSSSEMFHQGFEAFSFLFHMKESQFLCKLKDASLVSSMVQEKALHVKGGIYSKEFRDLLLSRGILGPCKNVIKGFFSRSARNTLTRRGACVIEQRQARKISTRSSTTCLQPAREAYGHLPCLASTAITSNRQALPYQSRRGFYRALAVNHDVCWLRKCDGTPFSWAY